MPRAHKKPSKEADWLVSAALRMQRSEGNYSALRLVEPLRLSSLLDLERCT
jgi:hypothetical protein